MIKVTLEIDNKTAHSCSPLEFLRKFILLGANEIHSKESDACIAIYETPYAKIKIITIEQI